MGSPLGTALASIFVDFLESRLFDNTVNRTFDAWAILLQYLVPSWFVTDFKKNLNLLHPAQKFTVDMEQNNSLNFVDVLVEKEGTGFDTSVYRKPTFTRQCIRWNSFCRKKD